MYIFTYSPVNRTLRFLTRTSAIIFKMKDALYLEEEEEEEEDIPYFHSSVSNVNFVLLKCVCVGGGPRNIPCMPRCRFNVLNVQLQKYIYYWSLEIF